MPFWKSQRPLDELQEEDERKSVELSIAQKTALMRRLKQDGLSVKKSFGGSLIAAWKWFKSH